jgi:SulP family sulfate permease
VQRFRSHGIEVEVAGLNQASATLVGRLDKTTNLKEV